MKGIVDDDLRALVELRVSVLRNGPKQQILAWVDTAFNGGLVIPQSQIDKLGLKRASIAEAVLANGKIVELETYSCYLNWFDREIRTQVIASESHFPLLGTMLLAGRKLFIDYVIATVNID